MLERVHREQRRPTRDRRKASRLLAVLLAFSLGACTLIEEAFAPPEPPEPVGASQPEAPPVAEPALPRAPRPRPARVARLPTERAQPQAASPQASEPDIAPAAIPMPEIKVVGLSRGEASDLLGTPAEERDAAPAKIWRYAASECAIDLYFYLDVARNDFYALHYNVHDSNGAVVGEAADRCLQRIYSEKHK
jgi:hypothetical protein